MWVSQQVTAIKTFMDNNDLNHCLLQTGYGATGLAHSGTVAEVIRTLFVKKEFQKQYPDIPVTLRVFVDDLDALRKVPTNFTLEQQEILNNNFGKAVSKIPSIMNDGQRSFSDSNVLYLNTLLKNFDVDLSEIEIVKSSEYYQSGKLNDVLHWFGQHAEQLKNIATHDYGHANGVGQNRKDLYCPFMPILSDGTVIQDITSWYIVNDILYYTPAGSDKLDNISILNGNCKLTWKLDWIARILNVENGTRVCWEPHGKDLISSVEVGINVCKYFNIDPPVYYQYELFLDENGKKISKSKGNGIDATEFVHYSPNECYKWFLLQDPKKSRKLFWGIIPQSVDNCIKDVKNNPEITNYIGDFNVPNITYQTLLNIATCVSTDDEDKFISFVKEYVDFNLDDYPALIPMIKGAMRYYTKFVVPTKIYKTPDENEKNVLNDIIQLISNYNSETLRSDIFDIGKKHYPTNLKEFFKMLYNVLMGQDSGPQFEKFVRIMGSEYVINLIKSKM